MWQQLVVDIFSSIQILDVSNCNLDFLPDTIEFLKNLKKLDLSHNNIKLKSKNKISMHHFYKCIKMVDKSNKNFEEELYTNLRKVGNDFNKDLMKKFKENESKRYQIIIDHIKKYLEPIFDKEFLLIHNGGKKNIYISLDLDSGEEEYFSLVNYGRSDNNEYDIVFLLDTCLRELIRLWKLEKSMKL